MFACSGCQRHILDSEHTCPFCGTRQRSVSSGASPGAGMLGAFALAAMSMLGSSACAKDTVPGNTGGTTTTTTTATETEAETETGSTPPDTNDSTNDTDQPSLSFYAPADDFVSVDECDPFVQDCPEGEKCVPYGSTGGNWDANKCVPIMGDGQPGDPCTYGGVVESTDDCDGSSFCWDVMDVDDMNIGTCTAFCAGTYDMPECAEGSHCLITNDDSIALCLAECDPLLQECPEGLGCFWALDAFICVFTTQDIPPGEPCGYLNDCEPGTFCADEELLPDCAGSSCCTEYCSLSDPEACPALETICVAFMDEDLPPGYEDLGICVLPPP